MYVDVINTNTMYVYIAEGREGVKWELGFALSGLGK